MRIYIYAHRRADTSFTGVSGAGGPVYKLSNLTLDIEIQSARLISYYYHYTMRRLYDRENPWAGRKKKCIGIPTTREKLGNRERERERSALTVFAQRHIASLSFSLLCETNCPVESPSYTIISHAHLYVSLSLSPYNMRSRAKDENGMQTSRKKRLTYSILNTLALSMRLDLTFSVE